MRMNNIAVAASPGLSWILGIAVVLLPVLASGHHSRAEYSDETAEFEGEFLRVSWRNPHPTFTFRVAAEDGSENVIELQAWGSPYTAVVVGTPLVFPGPKMGDGETLAALINEEGVTVSAGVDLRDPEAVKQYAVDVDAIVHSCVGQEAESDEELLDRTARGAYVVLDAGLAAGFHVGVERLDGELQRCPVIRAVEGQGVARQADAGCAANDR